MNNMGIKQTKQLFTLLAILPFLASSASFDCSIDESGVTASGVVCCRTSKDFGLFSCESGPEPRKMLLEFEVPAIHTGVSVLDRLVEKASIKGSYGVLAPDKDTQDRGNKVSYNTSILFAWLVRQWPHSHHSHLLP